VTLRLRLLLGYGYLVALMVLCAGSAMLGFLQLSQGIDVILEENFTSIAACTRMLEALERQDSATLLLLLDQAPDREELQRWHTAFEQSLQAAEDNVTEEAEQPILEHLRASYDQYRLQRGQLLEERGDRPLLAYNEQVEPIFAEVKADVLQLLDINHGAMREADRRARATAVQSGAGIGFLVTIGLLSLIVLSRALRRRLLEPLRKLTDGIEAIAQGEDRRRLPVRGEDELSQISAQLNAALDRQQELRAQMRGRLSQEKQLALALLAYLEGPVLVIGLDGLVMVDELGPLRDTIEADLVSWVLEEGAQRVRSLSNGEVPEPTTLDLAGETVTIELLQALGRRPVAWLVRPGSEAVSAR
jgi:NtrC-family two-component system sensor histidine kinase KinB